MTLVLKGIDQEILNESTSAIEAEIVKSVPYSKIDDVYVLEMPHIIKVRFRSMAMADKV